MGREQRTCDSRRMPISRRALRTVVHPYDAMRRGAHPAAAARRASGLHLAGKDPRQCARSKPTFHEWFFHNFRKQGVLSDTPLPEVSKRQLEVLALAPGGHSFKTDGRGIGISASTTNNDASLCGHLLAFADHGAEFSARSGNNWRTSARPSARQCGEPPDAARLRAGSRYRSECRRCGSCISNPRRGHDAMGSGTAFRSSRLAKSHSEEWEVAAA